jgi:hypothetical protein
MYYQDHKTEDDEVMVETHRKYGRMENYMRSFSQAILREETILNT